MKRVGILAGLVLAGCQGPRPSVYVDLDAAARTLAEPSFEVVAPAVSSPSLPAQSFRLPALSGAQLALTATKDRLEQARRIVRENRDEALRSLTAALYRAYAAEAEAEREAKAEGMAEAIEARWQSAESEISELLQHSAGRRWPLQNRLAFLAGFPFSDPALRPRPENRFDARRYDEAVAAWKALLAEDARFAAEVRRIVEAVEAEISSRRSAIMIDFTRALNEAADRARAEAPQAVAGNLPDYMGQFAESADVEVPATPERTINFEAVGTLPRAVPASDEPTPETRHRNLEQDLRIWLEQNGYHRAPKRGGVPDRTREFIQWMESRNAGP